MAGGKLFRNVVRVLALGIFVFLICSSGKAQEAQLAATPPMGWNSWNHYHCGVTDAIVRAQAKAMATNGMKDAGYTYINIDDCWQGERDAQGFIHPNNRFPDMTSLAEYVHGLGLKLGIYSSPGPKTCAGYEGSYGHETQDAETYAKWGVDYLKYDWCSAWQVYHLSQEPQVYKKMHDALVKTGRPIVFSLCQYGMDQVWKWGPSIGANLWRTTGDISPDFTRMVFIGFGQDGLGQFAGPGHWNDPDMLEVGNGQLSRNPEEEKFHMSLWCLLSAPLIAGNDLSSMPPEVLSILTNKEVIALDQDPKGVEAHRVSQEGPLQVWAKPLADGSYGVGLFNAGESTMPVTVKFSDLGLGASASVRDLWEHKDLGTFQNSYTAQVPRHGVVLIKVK